ncbi:beta-ketoacyl synthase N-terminal-like domain-containing protein [Streptomyces sp. NPDC006602]|uniref:beta-ketoacyl synthase N-terminal-like domain-containing protein n=1 Tax=Streptomyces sp. NPDC006602 TaxID=3364751 RepID=UPI00368A99E3
MSASRVLVTGIGVVAPSGVGAEEHWASLLRGELSVAPVEGFDTSRHSAVLAGQVRGFVPAEHVDERLMVQTDRWSWMSLATARMALDDAKYDPADHDPYATSVFLSAGSGGNEFGQREIQALWSRGRRAVGAYQSIAWFYAASTGQVSIKHGTKGPSGVVVSEAAGGLDSIGWARRALRRGTSAVLVGGTEAGITPYALTCQATSGRLSEARNPRQGYKPFDIGANGHVPGEGGAVLLLEDADAAERRSAPRVWGEIAGYGATHDAHHHEDIAPDSTQLARAVRIALDDARVTADQVDLVVADGAGSPELDALELDALGAVFSGRATPVPVTVPQGFTGRMMAGGSSLNVATALLAMRDGFVPAVGNLDQPVPASHLDLVQGSARRTEVRTALVVARGFGGFNSALVLRAA